MYIVHDGIWWFMLIHNERTYTVTSPNDTINPLIPLILFFSCYSFCPIQSRFRFRIPLLFHLVFVCILHFVFSYSRKWGRLNETGNYCMCPGLLSLGKLVANRWAFIRTSNKVEYSIQKKRFNVVVFFLFFFFFISHHHSHLQSFSFSCSFFFVWFIKFNDSIGRRIIIFLSFSFSFIFHKKIYYSLNFFIYLFIFSINFSIHVFKSLALLKI